MLFAGYAMISCAWEALRVLTRGQHPPRASRTASANSLCLERVQERGPWLLPRLWGRYRMHGRRNSVRAGATGRSCLAGSGIGGGGPATGLEELRG